MSNVRITFISDTHRKHKLLNGDLPGGDILIHSGDISSLGREAEVTEFINWFETAPYTHKVFISGNHDFCFEEKHGWLLEIFETLQQHKSSIIYLEDSGVELFGLKIYGSPWQPRFHDWAFNADRGEDIKKHWDKIPVGTDILITHGPPFGILDQARGLPLGCEELYKRVIEIKPLIHCFGHIHPGYGDRSFNDTLFLNAAILDDNYEYSHKPLTIDLDTETKDITYL